ncbi:hypothetical protein [Actinophytocola sp.]|uniref:hypothetical protein n=1 Tax=Actinophytocola sp. TaxID=1872138 RepID=UPI00389A06F3
MSRWARLPLSGLVLLALVAAGGCANKTFGTPTAVTTPSSARHFDDPDRLTAKDALGDLTRFNPCSVLDPAGMPAAWHVSIDVPAAYEYCVMSVNTKEGVQAEVQVGRLYQSDHESGESQSRAGGLRVFPSDDTGNACSRDIVFADGIALVVRSWAQKAKDATAMCGISDEVVDPVIDAVAAGRATSLTLPEHSLGAIDPCDVVTTEMATLVRGITAGVRPDRQLSGHSCWWMSDQGTMLEVAFDIGRLPAGDTGETTQGRYTAVTHYADDTASSTCAVVGEHVPFAFGSTTGLIERAGIWVYLKPGEVEAACTAGKQLADELWPELPPL